MNQSHTPLRVEISHEQWEKQNGGQGKYEDTRQLTSNIMLKMFVLQRILYRN